MSHPIEENSKNKSNAYINYIALLTKKKLRQLFGQAKNLRRSQQEQIEHKCKYYTCGTIYRDNSCVVKRGCAGAERPSTAGCPRRYTACRVTVGASPKHVVSPLLARLVTLSMNSILEGNVRDGAEGGRRSIATIVRVDVRGTRRCYKGGFWRARVQCARVSRVACAHSSE